MPIICATEICLQSSSHFFLLLHTIFPFQFLIIYYCYSYIHKSRVYQYIYIYIRYACLFTHRWCHWFVLVSVFWFSFHMFLLSLNRTFCTIPHSHTTSLRLIKMRIQTIPLQINLFWFNCNELSYKNIRSY